MPKKLNFLKEYQITQLLKPSHVLLLGETCRDEYHFGECKRISPEAPVPIFEYCNEELKFGMAHNVFNNLKSFNCSVDFKTNDSKNLIKRRFIDSRSHNQLLREDIGKAVLPCKESLKNDYDYVVISDYDKGFLTPEFIDYVCSLYPNKIIVDTKKKNLSCYKNCIIKCNEEEYSKISSMPVNSEIIVTKGKNGAEWKNKKFLAPSVEIFDVTGAGDVFLATFSVLFYQTKDIEYSIQKAVNLATLSTKHFGIYTLTEKDIYEICD